MMRLRPLALLVVSAVLAGCGGGGSSLPVASAGGGASSAANGRTARIAGIVHIPAPPKLAAVRRRSQYVSPATNSLVFKQGTYFTVIPVAAGAANCMSAQDGSRTCTFAANATPGTNVVYAVATFQSADGSGTPLSLATMTTTILPDTTNTLSLTLSPVVATLGVAITGASFSPGTKATQTVVVTAKDGAGDTIATGAVGLVDASGNPVTVALVDADTTGSTSLSPTTLTTTSTSTLTYTGSGDPTEFTIAADATSSAGPTVLASASASFVFTIPQSLYVLDGGNARIIEYALASDGSLAATATPRRIIDIVGSFMPPGSSTCAAVFGNSNNAASNIVVDNSGNIIVGLNCYDNNTYDTFFYQYGPNSDANQAPLAVFEDDSGPVVTFESANSTSTTDYFDGLSSNTTATIDRFSVAPATTTQTSMLPTTTVSATALASLPGATAANTAVPPPNYDPYSPVVAAGSNVYGLYEFDPASPSDLPADAIYRIGLPFNAMATSPSGAIAGASDQLGYGDGVGSLADGLATTSQNLYVLLAGDVAAGTATYAQSTQSFALSGPAGLAFCSATYEPTAAQTSCADGYEHDTLFGFGLSAVSATSGTIAATPVFAIGASPSNTVGLGCGSFGTGNTGVGNTVAAYAGEVYVANPSGANCSTFYGNGSASNGGSLPHAPYPSELDVYAVASLGAATNAAVPIVLKNSNVAPISVAIGPTGNVTSAVTTLATQRRASWPNLVSRIRFVAGRRKMQPSSSF